MQDLIKLIEEKLVAAKNEVSKLQEAYRLFTEKETQSIVSNMEVRNGNIGIVKANLNYNTNNPGSQDFSDFNATASFEEKARYYATKLNRAFSCIEFKKWIISMEGEDRAVHTLTHNISAEFKKLLKRGFIAAKFNDSNRHSYYLFTSWRTDDGSDIRPEYYPSAESFGSLAPDRRNRKYIKWLDK